MAMVYIQQLTDTYYKIISKIVISSKNEVHHAVIS